MANSEILSAERANVDNCLYTIVTVKIASGFFDFDRESDVKALVRQLRSAHSLFSEDDHGK
jgi:hypothetical protein